MLTLLTLRVDSRIHELTFSCFLFGILAVRRWRPSKKCLEETCKYLFLDFEHIRLKHGQKAETNDNRPCSKFNFVFYQSDISEDEANQKIQDIFQGYVKLAYEDDPENLYIDEEQFPGESRKYVFTWRSRKTYSPGRIRINYQGIDTDFRQFAVRWVVEADTGRVLTFHPWGEATRENTRITWERMYHLVF